jgi:hypothetical protein
VIASIRVGKLILPWSFRAYVNHKYCKEDDFEKSTEQAAQMIKEFKPPYNGKVIVAVDCSLCVKRVIEAVVEEGYQLVGWVSYDRRLEDGRYAREFPSGTVAKLKGLKVPVQIVQMYTESTDTTLWLLLTWISVLCKLEEELENAGGQKS